jgi:crossover junction endodeoxyribonuclease RuvC
LILGIDVGVSGAVVALNASGEIIEHAPMPTYKTGKANRVNPQALAGWIRDLGDVSHAYVEQVGPMPGDGERRMGASSAFSFGHAAGVPEGVIAALGIPITLVPPQAWKKSHGLVGKDKDAARTRAAQLYPCERTFDLKGKGQALADAVLIGLWGLKHAQ